MKKSSLLNFLKNPKPNINHEFMFWGFLKDLILFFVLLLVMRSFLNIINITILDVERKPIAEHQSIYLALFSLLLIPIIEELTFRLPLILSKINLTISMTLLSFSLSTIFIGNLYWSIIIALSVLAITYKVLSSSSLKRIKNLYESHFGFVFYGVAILFGGMHIFIYDYFTLSTWLLFPLICLPFAISGIIYGYLRLKYHILASFLLHLMWNSFIFFT